MSPIVLAVFVFTLLFITFFGSSQILLSPLQTIWNGIGLVTLSWLVTIVVNNVIIRSVCSMFRIPPGDKAVLITGCDTGFGRITALRLNKLGYHVFAGCLKLELSESGLMEDAASHQKMTVLQLDVTKRQEVVAAYEKVQEILARDGLHLHAIVNNAGINIPGMIEFAEDASVTDFEAVFNVNVLGAIRVCRMFAPLLRSRTGVTSSKGRIVNVSSQAAHSVAYGQSAYCMSKAALSVFTECLGSEVSCFGMHAIGIEPFFYKTQEANVPTFISRIQDVWNKMRPEVRDAYGPGVLEECIESNRFFATSDLAVNNNITEVPELIIEAVTSPFPDVLYVKVPLLPHCLLTILRSLPYHVRFEVNKQQALLNRLVLKYGRRDPPSKEK